MILRLPLWQLFSCHGYRGLRNPLPRWPTATATANGSPPRTGTASDLPPKVGGHGNGKTDGENGKPTAPSLHLLDRRQCCTITRAGRKGVRNGDADGRPTEVSSFFVQVSTEPSKRRAICLLTELFIEAEYEVPRQRDRSIRPTGRRTPPGEAGRIGSHRPCGPVPPIRPLHGEPGRQTGTRLQPAQSWLLRAIANETTNGAQAIACDYTETTSAREPRAPTPPSGTPGTPCASPSSRSARCWSSGSASHH